MKIVHPIHSEYYVHTKVDVSEQDVEIINNFLDNSKIQGFGKWSVILFYFNNCHNSYGASYVKKSSSSTKLVTVCYSLDGMAIKLSQK